MFAKAGSRYVNLEHVTHLDVREVGSSADVSNDPPQYYQSGLLTVLALTLNLDMLSGGSQVLIRVYGEEAEDIRKAID